MCTFSQKWSWEILSPSLIRPLLTKATPLTRSDFRYTERIIYHLNVPLKGSHPSFIRPCFHCRRSFLIKKALLYEYDRMHISLHKSSKYTSLIFRYFFQQTSITEKKYLNSSISCASSWQISKQFKYVWFSFLMPSDIFCSHFRNMPVTMTL